MDEKRTIERMDLKCAALVSKHSKKNGVEALRMLTRDISCDGAFLLTDAPLPVGLTIKVSLVVTLNQQGLAGNSNTLIKSTGTVVRTEENGMAVRFHRRQLISSLS